MYKYDLNPEQLDVLHQLLDLIPPERFELGYSLFKELPENLKTHLLELDAEKEQRAEYRGN